MKGNMRIVKVLRIIGIVWVTVSSAYLFMDSFNIQGPQWFILFPIYSLFDIGLGHICFFFSLLIMVWLLFRDYLEGKSDGKAIEFSFETILINLMGILLTFVHSWWGNDSIEKQGTHSSILLICVMGGIIGAWAVFVFQTLRLRKPKIMLLSSFIVNSALSVIAGGMLIFYSLVRIQKTSLYFSLKEHIFPAVIALILNLVVVKGWRES